MTANIVVDLGFGDSGKGITTDFLCSQILSDKSKIVVRYTGGHQVGHTVQIGDKHHVFSNFGSGTFRKISTYFTEHCAMYPVTIYNERSVLLPKMGHYVPNTYYHPLVKLTTPYDVVYNRITEKKNCHGSCGLGIGATMSRNNDSGYKLYAIDLKNKDILSVKLDQIGIYYLNKITNYEDVEYFLSESEREREEFDAAIKSIDFNIVPYDFLKSYDHLIFEGAQGILLDMDHGIFPHVTYGNTTSKNAIEVCKKIGVDKVAIDYVTRCYLTRHGNGWMDDDTDEIKLINNEQETNIFNEWQGKFRFTEINYKHLKYALDVDSIYSETIKRNLFVTCLDQRPDFKFDFSKLGNTMFHHYYNSFSPDSKDILRVY